MSWKRWLLAFAIPVLAFSSCTRNPSGTKHQDIDKAPDERFERLFTAVTDVDERDLLPVVDSMEMAGAFPANRANYYRGFIYARAGHERMAEQYLSKVYLSTDPEVDGWEFYLRVAEQLASARMMLSDQEGSLAVATEALERGEKEGKLQGRVKVGLLWCIAACQGQLRMKEAEETSLQVYQLLKKRAREVGEERDAVNLLAWTCVLFQLNLINEDYPEAEQWLNRAYEELNHPTDSTVVKQYTSELAMGRVELLAAQGKEKQAYALFRKTLPAMFNSSTSLAQAAEFLLDRERYDEAVDLFAEIDRRTPADGEEPEMNLDTMDEMIPRLKAYLGAGREEAVMEIARQIADNFEQALKEERENDAAELAVLYDTRSKEMQIAEQQAAMVRQRLIAFILVLGLLTASFMVYTWYSHRAANRLGEAHAELQKAYGQLEEAVTAKERIESELRIARDIQKSMLPDVFPQREGLDMYAEMTPAREVGGDLYNFLMQEDRLYFCVGDVSGKGVPASLFMAQSTRLFRTFAAEGLSPSQIAAHMNKELAVGNDSGMFITMFIGLLHLDTGQLDFCNCGHNAPLLDGQFLKMKHDNQIIGVWEEDPFIGERVDDIRGHQLLLYTDGLNEAENSRQELLGNDRLLALMADARSLSSHQVIDRLRGAAEKHRAGADPNDDLTLMCLRLS